MTPNQVSTVDLVDVDMISEFKFRRWARENYVTGEQRDPSWHPIVLDEMQRKDTESGDVAQASRA